MIDPISAVAMATSAYKTIQKMVELGRDVDDTLGQVGKWYSAISDFNEAKKQAENPPLFKKLFNGQSVEEEAMAIYIQDKKVKQQEKDLRELLMYTYGPEGYRELLAMRRKIKEQREKAIYSQARKRKALVWNTVSVAAIVAMIAALYQLTTILLGNL
jgi:intein-encoded DNA endonuclease-like protein